MLFEMGERPFVFASANAFIFCLLRSLISKTVPQRNASYVICDEVMR